MLALLELKTPDNMKKKNHNAQVVCEQIAASYLNRKYAVVSVLTDMQVSWTSYWFAKKVDDPEGSVVLHKLALPKEEKLAGLAKYILLNLFDRSNSDTLPRTFTDRLSFLDVQTTMLDSKGKGLDNDHEHRHESGNGQNSKGGNAGKARSHEQNSLSRSRGRINSYWQGRVHRSRKEMDIAEFLSLFAPPGSRSVANSLELMDMVDEVEQYEIVGDFAAKYVVPQTTGHKI
jgi:hypothetical protein